MHETLRRSSLGRAAHAARAVNLELRAGAPTRASAGTSCRATSTASARSSAVREDGFARVVTVEAEPELLRYVVEKGSITVDGVSLTVARIDERRASTSR